MLDVNDTKIDVLLDIGDESWLKWHQAHQWQEIIENTVKKTLQSLIFNQNSIELSVLLANDKEIKQLNSKYRQKDKATNVLSFPAYTEEELKTINTKLPYPVMLGDIAFAIETILKEAQDQKKTFLNHFHHLLVHGILHLVGFDHENDEQAETMEAMEIKILNLLNLSNPYQ